MINDTYRAMLVEERADGTFQRRIVERRIDELPTHDTLIRVSYSSLNYKDALSAVGNRGVTRHYPHQPGIDAAGSIVESGDPTLPPDTPVIVTGYDLGMDTAGGFGRFIRVPSDWVVPLPKELTLEEAMIYGTAGFTAALGLWRLSGAGAVRPEDGDVLVTGATGGVGSLAVAFLARAGYRVVASTGKLDREEYLRGLGAAEVVGRDAVLDATSRPLLKGRWAGVVDNVGGEYLTSAIRATKLHGSVTTCGNVASPEIALTVYPFILRGVALLGVDSGNTQMPLRREIWRRMATDWRIEQLHTLKRVVTLDGLDAEIDRILAGEQVGRVVLRHD